MSNHRLYQLLIAFLIITIIAFASERSRVLASILTVIPLNITIGLWFIFTGSSEASLAAADFLRMVLLGLVPTALFVLTCWLTINRGWQLWRALAAGYLVWLTAMAVYRILDSRLSLG
jgi:hypothetical protein